MLKNYDIEGSDLLLLPDDRYIDRYTIIFARIVAVLVGIAGLLGWIPILLGGAQWFGQALAFAVQNPVSVTISAFISVAIQLVEAYMVAVLNNPAGAAVRILAAVLLYTLILRLLSDTRDEVEDEEEA